MLGLRMSISQLKNGVMHAAPAPLGTMTLPPGGGASKSGGGGGGCDKGGGDGARVGCGAPSMVCPQAVAGIVANHKLHSAAVCTRVNIWHPSFFPGSTGSARPVPVAERISRVKIEVDGNFPTCGLSVGSGSCPDSGLLQNIFT